MNDATTIHWCIVLVLLFLLCNEYCRGLIWFSLDWSILIWRFGFWSHLSLNPIIRYDRLIVVSIDCLSLVLPFSLHNYLRLPWRRSSEEKIYHIYLEQESNWMSNWERKQPPHVTRQGKGNIGSQMYTTLTINTPINTITAVTNSNNYNSLFKKHQGIE